MAGMVVVLEAVANSSERRFKAGYTIPMSIRDRTVHDGKVAIIDVRGTLVSDGDATRLKESVSDFIEQGVRYLVINLDRVTYINSIGIGAIISAHTSYARIGGEAKLAGMNRSVQNVFVVTKLVDVFDVHDTVDDAVRSFIEVKQVQ